VQDAEKRLAAVWGTSLRARRQARGMTQAKLGEAVGLSHATISRWERGHAVPADRHKVRLAQVLGVSPRALFPLERR